MALFSPGSPAPGEAPNGADVPEGLNGVASTRAIVLQGLLVLGGLATYLLLLLEYGAALNPLHLALAGLILLWPLRGQRRGGAG